MHCALIFYFCNIEEVALRTTVIKICYAFIALRFQNFFRLIAQFYPLNLILLHFNRNTDKFWPSLANYLLFFLSKIVKNAVFQFCFEIFIAKVRLRFNLVRKCRSAIAELRCALTESKVHCGSCAAL